VHDLSAVRESVAGEFIGAGVALESMFALLAAFVAGLTPICSGDAAQEALRAVARAVCGGNAWWLPVSPVTTSLQDVLAPASKQPGLGVGGLGDVLEAALQRPDELVLAVLESVDLAPTDCFVPPLLEFAQISPNTRSGRVPMMARDGIGVCEWPRNMLLAFTITRSLTALRMPRRVAELAPLLNFDWTSISLEAALAARNLVRVAVAPWREVQITAEPLTAIEGLAPVAISPPVYRLAARLYKAGLALGTDPASARQIAFTHVIAPALAAAGGALPEGASDAAVRHFDLAKSVMTDLTDI
jgi:hypothetical protein